MTRFTTNTSFPNEHANIQLKLIYFWAYVEAGLAGLLHLLHIPITGLVAGGFSIIVNVLLAHYSQCNVKAILKALSIVLAVKFVFSPITPPGAYVAVCFQGLLATVIFGLFKVNRLSIFIFSLLVMLESALQKPLIAYLIFGKQFWVSTIAMIKATFKISNLEALNRLTWMIGIYILLYILWACLITFWANQLRYKLEHIELTENQKNNLDSLQQNNNAPSKSFRHTKIPVLLALSFFFIILIFPFIVQTITLAYLIRLAFILLLAIFIFPYLIRKHQSFLFRKNEKLVSDIALQIPLIKQRTTLAWEFSKHYVWYQRIRYFVYYAIWLNVFYEES
jgi:hypothetical protein